MTDKFPPMRPMSEAHKDGTKMLALSTGGVYEVIHYAPLAKTSGGKDYTHCWSDNSERRAHKTRYVGWWELPKKEGER